MLYKTGFVSISTTVAEWQATQNCVTDRHKIFPPTAIAPILNGGWDKKSSTMNMCLPEKTVIFSLFKLYQRLTN